MTDFDELLNQRIEWAKNNMGQLMKMDGYNAYLIAINHVHENYHTQISGRMGYPHVPPTEPAAGDCAEGRDC